MNLLQTHPWCTFISFRVVTTGRSQPGFFTCPLDLELPIPQTHPYAPEVSPHKTLFQQIPYLLSRERLQQLQLLSALSGRRMAIIKAALSSPLLLGNGLCQPTGTWKSTFSDLVCYYFFSLLARCRCWVQVPSL